ncbi:hypothetical protein HAX54_020340 [Datura stramonium]|uniref:Uncharacterized protein n=1 Tax=Datura stramonium TaxID=4076 RepID=A0ABS8S364_DATST|nr:hypothetical protein [Datura stramonium]
MEIKLLDRREPDGPSPPSLSNQVIIPLKLQPTRGCAQRRNVRTETTYHLKNENTDSKNEFDEGDDSSANGCSLGGANSNSEEESGNEATSRAIGDSEPLRVHVLKDEISGFRGSLRWQVKGDDRCFQEGLTTIVRGHLKWSIAEEVRIIDSKLFEYLDIERRYKFYGLGWMTESSGYYYPNMIHEFYANYVATLEGQCKKEQKPADMRMLLRVQVHGEPVDITSTTINRMLYEPDFTLPASTTEFDYRMREWHNQRSWLLRRSHIPILTEIEIETPATKKYDLEKSKDETSTGIGSVGHIAQILTSTPSTSGAAAAPPNTKSAETSSAVPQASQCALMPENFAKMIEPSLLLWIHSLRARIDDIEAQVNDRLKDLTMPDLAKFVAELKKAQDDILMLQQEQQPQEFSISIFEELEEDVPFIDLLGDQPKVARKYSREGAMDEALH